MEEIIGAVALSIMGIGLIAAIIGLVQFTRSFVSSPEEPPPATTESHRSTGP